MLSISQRICSIIVKWDIAPGRYIWNNYLCQAATAIERKAADARHAVGDCNRCQAATIHERIIANACHAVGNGDGGQAATIIESIIADACYGGIYNSLEIISLPCFE